jgi:dihydrofolate reductase
MRMRDRPNWKSVFKTVAVEWTHSMIIIGAMATNRVIGSGDGMPWDVPEEYAHFLQIIEGQTIIIGRRSYEIFGGNLTSAHNIVVSKAGDHPTGAVVVPSIPDAMRVAESFSGTFFSAGGASIYAQTIPLADTMYLSSSGGSSPATRISPRSASRSGPSTGGRITRGSSPWSTAG